MQLSPALHAKLAHEVPDARAALGAGGTLPYTLIGDPELLRAEQRMFFEANWQAVCYAADLDRAGARKVSRLGAVPVLLVRGTDGLLRGFVNACRHRAFQVATDDGTSPRLMCRYHSWTYGLDGCLLRAPDAEGKPGFDKAAMGLLPVSVTTWRGIVFAHADPDAPPLVEDHPALDAFADDVGFDLTGFRPLHTFSIDMPCDWKLLNDNIVECYHCPSMHAQSLSSMYATSGFEGARWRGQVRHATALMPDGAGRHECIQMFPGTFLTADPVIAIVGRFTPMRTDLTRVEFRFAAAPDTDPDLVQHYTDGWAATLGEDREILAGQAEGVASGKLPGGVLVAGQEDCLRRVQDLILSGYERALAVG